MGFRNNQVELKPCGKNLVSAREHPEVVCGYLQEEVSSGRVIDMGDSKTAESLGVHCSPFGGDPEDRKAREMEADRRPLLPGAEQCQRWHQQGAVIAVLPLG